MRDDCGGTCCLSEILSSSDVDWINVKKVRARTRNKWPRTRTADGHRHKVFYSCGLRVDYTRLGCCCGYRHSPVHRAWSSKRGLKVSRLWWERCISLDASLRANPNRILNLFAKSWNNPMLARWTSLHVIHNELLVSNCVIVLVYAHEYCFILVCPWKLCPQFAKLFLNWFLDRVRFIMNNDLVLSIREQLSKNWKFSIRLWKRFVLHRAAPMAVFFYYVILPDKS